MNMTTTTTTTPRRPRKIERIAQLRWVPLAQIRYHPLAQRDLNLDRVRKLVDEFDLEQFGNPTANHRDGTYFVIDGQHRIEALKAWFGEGQWEGQQIQCWLYEDLSDAEMAEIFLKLNDVLTVSAFEKFRKAVTAGRPEESAVAAIVSAYGVRVSRGKAQGATMAVGALMRVYRRDGDHALGKALRILLKSFGDAGLQAVLIDAFGLLASRYGDIDEDRLTGKLAGLRGGINALLNKAELLRRATGNALPHCVAAATVDIYNAGRGGRHVSPWWRAGTGGVA